jgi:hypothetical protein
LTFGLENLAALLSSEESQEFEDLQRLALQGEPRRALSASLKQLIQAVLGRHHLENKLIGPLMGEFWRAIPSSDTKKHSAPVTLDDRLSNEVKSLRGLADSLPYPLSYKWNEFLLEFEKFEKGYGSSNFPFLLASLNGLALRMIAFVAVSEYVASGASDAWANESIVPGLRHPSDGTWKQLFEVVWRVHKKGHVSLPLTRSLGEALRRKYKLPGSKKGSHSLQLMNGLIALRNQLLHGSRSFATDELKVFCLHICCLYRAMEVMGGWKWVLEAEKGRTNCMGGVLVWELSDSYPLHGVAPGVVRVSVNDGEDAVSLWPFLVYSEALPDDLYCLNGWHDEGVEFLSYRYARHFQYDEVGVQRHELLAYMRRIPVAPIPADVRFDFSEQTSAHAAHFVGRRRVLRHVMDFLMDRTRPYGMIKAYAGMGKTALLSVLHQRFLQGDDWPHDVFPVWHFCSATEGQNHPVWFLRSMIAQIDGLLGRDQQEYPTHLDMLREDFRERLVCLQQECQGKHVVLIVDALDEALERSFGSSLIPALLPTIEECGDVVSVLVSYRVDQTHHNELVERLLPVDIRAAWDIPGCCPLSGLSYAEVEELFHQLQLDIPLSEGTLEAIWHTSATRSGRREVDGTADPFVLRFLVDACLDGVIAPNHPETVPESLGALFDQFWNELPTKHDYFVHRLLGLLAVMKDVGGDDFFAGLFSMQEGHLGGESLSLHDVAERRLTINKMLVFSGDRYRLFHDRFRAYVLSRFRPVELVREFHATLYEYATARPLRNGAYGFRYGSFHLGELAHSEALSSSEVETYRQAMWSLMLDDSFFSSKFRAVQRTESLYQDFLEAFDVFRPKSEGIRRSDAWREVAYSFHICHRSREVIARAKEQSLRAVSASALRGDAEHLARVAMWSGSALRRMLWLLLAAVGLSEAGHSSARLFGLMTEVGSVVIPEGERAFYREMLGRAKAPEHIYALFSL